MLDTRLPLFAQPLLCITSMHTECWNLFSTVSHAYFPFSTQDSALYEHYIQAHGRIRLLLLLSVHAPALTLRTTSALHVPTPLACLHVLLWSVTLQCPGYLPKPLALLSFARSHGLHM